MNLLYISNISGKKFSGPNYSIPSQIYAQSKVDRVYWLDLSNHDAPYDEQRLCHHLSDMSGSVPDSLPVPFDQPDLVIFEEFYRFRHPIETIVHRLIQKSIPYIIIPRSQMTRQGRVQKRIKKWVCSVLFFDRFVKKSAAIQYLTAAEKKTRRYISILP